MEFQIRPVAFVKNSRKEIADDFWGGVVSEIELADWVPEDAFEAIESYSHLEIIFYFHKIRDEQIVFGTQHPRNNVNFPKVGIFSRRSKAHPTRLGLTSVKLLKHEGRTITVQGLDAIDGTPVIDIKPVHKEYFPREEVRQPAWVSDLLKDYWK